MVRSASTQSVGRLKVVIAMATEPSPGAGTVAYQPLSTSVTSLSSVVMSNQYQPPSSNAVRSSTKLISARPSTTWPRTWIWVPSALDR